ncbi:hypothetical protein UPYG_G00116980 [Umbra pygmaea]|uniref:Zinc finger protein 541 n=1 Tax=Umbra pygmaea TaxID=75934 RepID=A0ABD0X4Z1_UMBPY
MTNQQTYQDGLLGESLLETEECPRSCWPLSSEGFTIEDDNVLNVPDPLLTSTHLFPPEQWMGFESVKKLENDKSSGPVMVEEIPLLEPCALAVPVRCSAHECTHCHKMLGTVNALNKHLLTHQQERPFMCPICQKAFKRHDHLTGHMLTHQKRRPFQCSVSGCRKSYCDAHSLKRHYISQHGAPLRPPIPASLPTPVTTEWAPVDSVAYPGGPASHSDDHPMFLDRRSDTQQTVPYYSGCGSFKSCTRFASSRSLQLNNCSKKNTSQSKSIFVLDTWRQRPDQGPCRECPGELHPPQWAPEPTTILPLPTRVEGPSLHGWESGVDFPMSELQVLEDMTPHDSCSKAGSSVGACLVEPADPQQESQANPELSACLQQTCSSVKLEGKLKTNPLLPPFGPTASSDSSVKFKMFPNTVFIRSQSSLPKKSDPAIAVPSVCTVLKSETCKTNKDSRRKGQKKMVTVIDHPAPPLPTPYSTFLLAPRRPRPRPHYLVSPSQVAMASFSLDSHPRQLFKVGKTGLPGEGCESSDSIFSGSHKPNHSPTRSDGHVLKPNHSPTRSEGHVLKTEPPSPEPIEKETQNLRSASTADHNPLSPLVIPVSVPVSVLTDLDIPSPLAEKSCGRSKRSRRLDLLKTLTIPPPLLPQPPPTGLPGAEDGGTPWCRAAGGYPSQLRSPMYQADHLLDPGFQPPPYTPPPMLSPLRPGTGLYFNTVPWLRPDPPPPSTYTASLDGDDGISLMMDDTLVSIKPRINVGQRFQADIPPIRNLLLMLYDEHPAQLVWTPWGDISTNVETQKAVTALMELCCSSVLPGGGTNTELALHCLHEVQGDVLAALDLLLIRGDFRTSTHPLSDYHYPGSDDWSTQEKKLFRKALLTHDKDFQLIHSVLQTKSVRQCVEYYYTVKKLNIFKQRSRGSDNRLAVGLDPQQMETPDHVGGQRGSRGTLTKPDNRTPAPSEEQATIGGALEYSCQECGRVFDRVKSRSAHMKTHRQQEREWQVWLASGTPCRQPSMGSFISGL